MHIDFIICSLMSVKSWFLYDFVLPSPKINYNHNQASSSFKRLYMRTFTYATPTFITEALRLVTLVKLLLTTATEN